MKPTLFIVEGPDCSGKTTLAKYLANYLSRAAYFRCHGTPLLFPAMSDVQNMVLENAAHCIQHLGMSYVLDRFWPSEFIYGQIFRPKTKNFEFNLFASRCAELSAVYIYCDSPGAMERHKANKDPKHPYDDGDFQKVIDGYRAWYAMIEAAKYRRRIKYILEEHGSYMPDFCQGMISGLLP